MKKQHCVVMDDELSQEIKITAIKECMSMSDLISKACVEYLKFRKQLVERGLIFDDVRDMKPTLNSLYGVTSQQYVDNNNTQGM